jgi:hypothetical protein
LPTPRAAIAFSIASFTADMLKLAAARIGGNSTRVCAALAGFAARHGEVKAYVHRVRYLLYLCRTICSAWNSVRLNQPIEEIARFLCRSQREVRNKIVDQSEPESSPGASNKLPIALGEAEAIIRGIRNAAAAGVGLIAIVFSTGASSRKTSVRRAKSGSFSPLLSLL